MKDKGDFRLAFIAFAMGLVGFGVVLQIFHTTLNPAYTGVAVGILTFAAKEVFGPNDKDDKDRDGKSKR